jgi:hypothetical protein
MFLKIINNETQYEGFISVIAKNIIRVQGLPQATAGFYLYRDNNYERLIGNYSTYTTLYRVIDVDKNIYEYSNDGSKYVAPVEELIIVDNGQREEYKPTIEEIRTHKIDEFKILSNRIIEQGETVTLSDGSQDEFNYTQMNQMNLVNAFNLAVATQDSVPYYDKDNVCKIYSVEDIIRIYSSCQILVTYHVTLAHQLADQIKNMESIEEIKTLEYSYESLDEQHKKNFDTIMAQTQKIAQKVFQQ